MHVLNPLNRLTELFMKEFSAAKSYDPADDWSISPFPNGYSFAFTIVHDADAAYSRRLEPLFEVFDEFGLKITATVFTFWADWAENGKIWREWKDRDNGNGEFVAPHSVPLVDDKEREFYLRLKASGHEIGMHTPSDTSNTRADVIRAFEYFKKVFGRYPRVYVEHAVTRNKEAQASEGSKPQSKHFITDLLNSYEPWVWVDDDCGVPDKHQKRFYDILAVNGSPFNTVAAARYGIAKAFLRTGRWREADGDGFLSWYSEENIDALEQDRGLALVYMHLDSKWLDVEARKMRTPIKERLRYLASKNGWFVPAGVILDRVRAVHKLKLYHSKKSLKLVNTGSDTIDGLTLTSNRNKSLCNREKQWHPGRRGDIVLGAIHPGETLWFKIV
jgi:peptidoglycan/xylan/chitin deacetylase (PgdA/CDA1 family)